MRLSLKTELKLAEAFGELNNGDSTARALSYALKIIESYEIDIRNSKEIVDIDLAKAGFCQGSIYRTARNTIRRILREGLRV